MPARDIAGISKASAIGSNALATNADETVADVEKRKMRFMSFLRLMVDERTPG
jgi:hypothetical protein